MCRQPPRIPSAPTPLADRLGTVGTDGPPREPARVWPLASSTRHAAHRSIRAAGRPTTATRERESTWARPSGSIPAGTAKPTARRGGRGRYGGHGGAEEHGRCGEHGWRGGHGGAEGTAARTAGPARRARPLRRARCDARRARCPAGTAGADGQRGEGAARGGHGGARLSARRCTPPSRVGRTTPRRHPGHRLWHTPSPGTANCRQPPTPVASSTLPPRPDARAFRTGTLRRLPRTPASRSTSRTCGAPRPRRRARCPPTAASESPWHWHPPQPRAAVRRAGTIEPDAAHPDRLGGHEDLDRPGGSRFT